MDDEAKDCEVKCISANGFAKLMCKDRYVHKYKITN